MLQTQYWMIITKAQQNNLYYTLMKGSDSWKKAQIKIHFLQNAVRPINDLRIG